MASVGDLLFKMMGRPDPMAQLQAVAGGSPPAPAGTPAVQGTDPATAPPAQPPEAAAYRSPSQLVDLYIQLMDRQQRNAQIDRGIGLMGASLAHPENRAGILATFGGRGGGGGGNPGDVFSSLMDFQAKQAAASQKAQQRASVPAIASQYGLDTTTALYLFDMGKLDSIIAELEKPNNEVIKGGDGKDYLVDRNTGLLTDLGVPAPKRKIIVQDGPNGSKVAVYEDDLTKVEGRDPLVPEDPYSGDTELSENWKRNNEDRKNRGLPPLSLEDWKKLQSSATQGAGIVDSSGAQYPDPPKDMVWDKDANGVVKKDERGAPIAVPIGGTEIDLKQKEAKQEAEDAKKVVEKQAEIKQQTADIVTEDIDRALGMIEKSKDGWLPATGFGGVLENVPLTPAGKVGEMIKTIRANVGFDKLQAMRSASPTGAALGPVSDFENELLQSTLGNLKLWQDPEVVKYNLKRIKRIYTGVVSGEFVTKQPDGSVVPNQEAISKAYQDTVGDMSIEELMKMYPGDK